MIEFLWPWAFLLLPLPLLVNRLLPRAESSEAPLYVPFYASLSKARAGSASLSQRRLLLTLLMILSWSLLILALSRPQWIGEPIRLPATGRDLMLIVDVSGSMEARDMQVQGRSANRLDVVKEVIGDFVERRTGDRLGLILFAARAHTQAPLTFDRVTVGTLLEEVHIGIVQENATAIGDAIGLGIRHLLDRPENSRVLIMLTDGINNAGEISPLQAGNLAAQAGITLYTIGVGGDPTPRGSPFGARAVSAALHLDEDLLTLIAENTGGQYFRARDVDELARIYEILDELEPVEQDEETFRPTTALFYWPLALSLLLSFIIALIKLPWGNWRTASENHEVQLSRSRSAT